jgi:hypothetical protein
MKIEKSRDQAEKGICHSKATHPEDSESHGGCYTKGV